MSTVGCPETPEPGALSCSVADVGVGIVEDTLGLKWVSPT